MACNSAEEGFVGTLLAKFEIKELKMHPVFEAAGC